MTPPIVLLGNPRARRVRRHPELRDRLEGVIAGHGWCAWPDTLEALDGAAARAHAEGARLVVVHGGDGTCHAVLTAVVRAWGDDPLPRIALLPGGTMNTIAKNLGLRGAPDALLRGVLRALARDPVPIVRQDLVAVGGTVGFLFGTGVIANYLEPYYEGSEPGPAKAAWVLLRAALSALVGGRFARRITRPVRAVVTVDDEELPERRFLAVGAGAVADVGLGFRPFFRAMVVARHLHGVFVASSAFRFAFELPGIWLGRPMRHPLNRDRVLRRLHLRSEEPITYMVDGDLHVGPPTLEVTVGPELEIVVPPDDDRV